MDYWDRLRKRLEKRIETELWDYLDYYRREQFRTYGYPIDELEFIIKEIEKDLQLLKVESSTDHKIGDLVIWDARADFERVEILTLTPKKSFATIRLTHVGIDVATEKQKESWVCRIDRLTPRIERIEKECGLL